MDASAQASQHVMTFATGLLYVVLAAALILFVSSVIWEWGQRGKREPLLESKQLHFAAVTLTGLGLLFALAMAMYYWSPKDHTPAKEIFDACKTIIPPIITLILGYYFGREKGSTDVSSRARSDQPIGTQPDIASAPTVEASSSKP